MGNCVRRESSMVWAEEEEWATAAPGRKVVLYDVGNDSHGEEHDTNMEERQSLLGEEGNSSGSKREVKIKITKRELEELMARVEMQGLTMEELLARLLNSSDDPNHHLLSMEDDDDHHHRSWKPALQSIPE